MQEVARFVSFFGGITPVSKFRYMLPAFLGLQFAANLSMYASVRWSYCTVDSNETTYVSDVFRYDFGGPYNSDPQIYGRLVNRFTDAVIEQYGLKKTAGAWCYVPVKDEGKETVEERRQYLIGHSKTVHVDWPR